MPLSRALSQPAMHLAERCAVPCVLEKGWCARGLTLGAEKGRKWQRKHRCPRELWWEAAGRSALAGGRRELTFIGTRRSLQRWEGGSSVGVWGREERGRQRGGLEGSALLFWAERGPGWVLRCRRQRRCGALAPLPQGCWGRILRPAAQRRSLSPRPQARGAGEDEEGFLFFFFFHLQ